MCSKTLHTCTVTSNGHAQFIDLTTDLESQNVRCLDSTVLQSEVWTPRIFLLSLNMLSNP